MFVRHHIRIGLAGLVAAAVAGTAVAAGPALAAQEGAAKAGDRSLAKVLAADSGFDRNAHDFDILDKAVGTVLTAKPDSPVAVLADGDTRLTAFLPTDGAFRALVEDLTGEEIRKERKVFKAVASVADVDTLEAVLLYHVVAGQTLRSGKIVKLDGTSVTSAGGGEIGVRVKKDSVRLRDQDPDARNPRVVAVDINKGNKQVGHAIDRVLRPLDL